MLVSEDTQRGRTLLIGAAAEIERLGVHHLSEQARALAAN
jgi:hypothetical protein